MELSQEQRAANSMTWQHIDRVSTLLHRCAIEMLHRAESHDRSKLGHPEVEQFAEQTHKLANQTFGSEEEAAAKQALDKALAHHYANNRHHPQHFKHGIEDMNLFDIVEWLVDCKASSERQDDGNIRKSFDILVGRFNINPQLARILENTIDLIIIL